MSCPACSKCKSDARVEPIGLNYTAPEFMEDALWICLNCHGYMNGNLYQGLPLVQYGWTAIYWPGYDENIDKARDKALEILDGKGSVSGRASEEDWKDFMSSLQELDGQDH